MRFETSDIVIELITKPDGGVYALLLYPNPLKQNVRLVWHDAPDGCKKINRGLRIDFDPPPMQLQVQIQEGREQDETSKKERARALFFEAQEAYLDGKIELVSTDRNDGIAHLELYDFLLNKESLEF